MAIDFKHLRTALKALAQMPAPFEGGCLCGAVRYRCDAAPIWSGHCHCDSCKKLSGGPYTTAFTVMTDRFTVLQGEVLTFARGAESGHAVRTQRCKECGTWVWAERDSRPGFRAVLGTTLDDMGALPIVGQAYVSEASSWITLDPNVTQFQRMPEDELPPPR